jgi:dTDP-glucose 4,6-dehydratase
MTGSNAHPPLTLPSADLRHLLDHTRPLWDELRGQRLFITGGTGFFGCWLVESFVAACDALKLDAEAVVLTRNPERFAAKAPHLAAHRAIRLHRGDVADFAFPEGAFSHIIHAATVSGGPVPEAEMTRTMLEGTERVLALTAQCGAQKLLFTSSGAFYGRQPASLERLSEAWTPDPAEIPPQPAYTMGKRAVEQLLQGEVVQQRLETKIARCFAFVGPHLPIDAHFAIGNFIRDAMRGTPIHIQGDGTPLRSYLYAADLAIWLWTILFKGPSGRAYNVGSPHAVSIRELAETVGRLYSTPVHVAQAPTPGAPIQRYIPDTRRASTELGLEAWIGLEEAIQRTVAWHRGAV